MNVLLGIAVAVTMALVRPVSAAEPVGRGGSTPEADYSDPIKTYRTYLEAVKRDDLQSAKACFEFPGDKPDAFDMGVSMWIAYHRFGKIVSARFGKHESAYLREDCADVGLDRTLARLSKSTFKINGDKAELKIRWEENDGSENKVFEFGGDAAIPFVKVRGQWKHECKAEDSEVLSGPGTWGWAFRESGKMLDQTSDEIEAGKLKTWKQVAEVLDRRTKELEKKFTEDHHDP